MRIIKSEKRFYILSITLLVVVFIITLIQNIIRYSHHATYNVWISVLYLCISILLFIPFMILCFNIQKKIQLNYGKWFWPLTIILAFSCLVIFYLVSGIVLHSFGYFNHYIDSEYAGYYFGREALYHLLFVLGSGVFVYASKERTSTIDVWKGRKMITLGVDLIQWIEAEGHYLNFHTENDTFIKRENIGSMSKHLQPDFIRIHRKYIVNKNQIVATEKHKRDEYVVLSCGDKLKIGPSFKPISW
ncbi:MAG: LytTR family DNA-binding domain-containing protein [Allomuricauda sp.]